MNELLTWSPSSNFVT